MMLWGEAQQITLWQEGIYSRVSAPWQSLVYYPEVINSNSLAMLSFLCLFGWSSPGFCCLNINVEASCRLKEIWILRLFITQPKSMELYYLAYRELYDTVGRWKDKQSRGLEFIHSFSIYLLPANHVCQTRNKANAKPDLDLRDYRATDVKQK